MQVQEVTTANLEQIFYKVPFEIYAKEKNWIAPLGIDIKNVFDENANPFYKPQTCKRWIIFNSQQKAVGRIAAFYNPAYKNKHDACPVGGFGFFECVHDFSVAKILLDTAKDFLITQGCEAMDGPINLGERDKFWGLLIKGFQRPLYGMNYHLPYYKELLEQYGLQIFYEQFCFDISIQNWQDASIQSIKERLEKKSQYQIVSFDKKQLQKFVADFVTIYNAAWQQHDGNKVMTVEKVRLLFQKMDFFIDERIILLMYHNNKPIGFFLNLPDLNFYFKHIKGEFNLYSKAMLFFNKIFFSSPKIIGLAYGVIPEYQSKGLDALFIFNLLEKLKGTKYEVYEMQWIGSFNKKMINFVQKLHSQTSRVLATYRMYFKPNIPFQQHPDI